MLKIIIADDEPFFIEGLKVLIDWEKHGYEIIGVAYNGEEAIEKIIAQKPDVVLTDLRMPEIEGLEIIRKCIKELYLNPKFIIISGYDDFSYAQKAMKYGVNHYILKPVDEETLINALSEIKADLFKHSDFSQSKHADIFLSEALMSAILKNDSMAIEEEIDKYLSDLSKKQLPSSLVTAFSNHLFVEAMKTVHALGGIAGDFIEKHQQLIIDANSSIDDLKLLLCNICNDYAQFITDLKLKQSNRLMMKIDQYIHANYHQSINLKKLSEVFYINPVYLGQLFSKHFNMYFHDYLNKIRIEEAQKLLRTTDMKVYEVADKVGFQNVDYFINKFKKRVNCTPLHYRSQMKAKA